MKLMPNPTLQDIGDFALPLYRESADAARKILRGEELPLPANLALNAAGKLTGNANGFARTGLSLRREARLETNAVKEAETETLAETVATAVAAALAKAAPVAETQPA